MPFNGFWQYQNALLVESANLTIPTAGTSSYSANPGDIIIHATNSTGGAATAAITITLPAVGLGGPVTIKQNATVGTVTVKSLETSGVYIDGTAGTTGVTLTTATQATYASDGSQWWRVA